MNLSAVHLFYFCPNSYKYFVKRNTALQNLAEYFCLNVAVQFIMKCRFVELQKLAELLLETTGKYGNVNPEEINRILKARTKVQLLQKHSHPATFSSSHDRFTQQWRISHSKILDARPSSKLSFLHLMQFQGFIRPVARVGSGDPVRVLRLYTTITLDEVCSIYC